MLHTKTYHTLSLLLSLLLPSLTRKDSRSLPFLIAVLELTPTPLAPLLPSLSHPVPALISLSPRVWRCLGLFSTLQRARRGSGRGAQGRGEGRGHTRARGPTPFSPSASSVGQRVEARGRERVGGQRKVAEGVADRAVRHDVDDAGGERKRKGARSGFRFFSSSSSLEPRKPRTTTTATTPSHLKPDGSLVARAKDASSARRSPASLWLRR